MRGLDQTKVLSLVEGAQGLRAMCSYSRALQENI